MNLRTATIRLAYERPELRPFLIPLIRQADAKHGPGDVWRTEEGNWRAVNNKGVAKSFGDDKGSAETHAGKGKPKSKPKSEKGKGEKGKGEKSAYSSKHRVYLSGITEADLDHFEDNPEGKELLEKYNLRVIAGSDGVVHREDLERAVNVRRKLKAINEAKDKKKRKEPLTDEEKASLDVCKASPPVCKGNLGIERSSMPQFLGMSVKKALGGISDSRFKELQEMESSGRGLKDATNDEREAYYNRKNAQAAVDSGADPDSDESVFDSFVSRLKKQGVEVGEVKGGVRVGDLSATQQEISSDKTMENADKFLQGRPVGGVIYISDDGYILDGHHRWSGVLAANPDAKIPAVRIGLPIKDLLEESFASPGVFRQDFRFEVVPKDNPIDLAYERGSTWKQRNGKWYGKNSQGKTGGPFESKESAEDFAKGKSASLRTRVIRLAHANPELRGYLLPLLAR